METEYLLTIERDVDVPAHRLFDGWTDPKMILKWFTPRPWKTTHAVIELKPGGAYSSTMQSPEGEEVHNHGCVLDFERDRRFVFTNMMRAGFVPNEIAAQEFGMVAVLEFIAKGQGATYRAHVYHDTEKGMKTHEAMGFEAGWNAALDQLVELIKNEG